MNYQYPASERSDAAVADCQRHPQRAYCFMIIEIFAFRTPLRPWTLSVVMLLKTSVLIKSNHPPPREWPLHLPFIAHLLWYSGLTAKINPFFHLATFSPESPLIAHTLAPPLGLIGVNLDPRCSHVHTTPHHMGDIYTAALRIHCLSYFEFTYTGTVWNTCQYRSSYLQKSLHLWAFRSAVSCFGRSTYHRLLGIVRVLAVTPVWCT